MISKLTLKDPTLLRDACLVAGEWVAADSGGTVAVDNPSATAKRWAFAVVRASVDVYRS